MLFLETFSKLILLQLNALTNLAWPWEIQTADSLQNLPSGESFLQQKDVLIKIRELIPEKDHWIYYLLFIMLGILAIIRYYFPGTLANLISLSSRAKVIRGKEDDKGPSGLIAPLFLFVNFLVGMGLLGYAFAKVYSEGLVQLMSYRLFIVLFFMVLFYYTFTQLLVLLAGFLFETRNYAFQHIQMATHTAFDAGLFLNPLMLFYFYTRLNLFIYLALVSLMLLWGFKILQLIKIGLSVRKIRPFHIFLYLCAIEFLPLVLLIKMGMDQLMRG